MEALARHSLDGPLLKYGSSIKINIVQLTEAELIDLNYPIVGHLRILDQMYALIEMLEVKIGQQATFQPPSQGQLEGA